MRVDQDNKKKESTTNNTNKTIIHNVIISDASGSMEGSKYQTSVKSIKTELEILSKDTNSKFLHTLVEFDDPRYVKHFSAQENVSEFNPIGASGGTPLYNTMGRVFEELEAIVKPNERVLIKIFTDGDDTFRGQGKYNSNSISTYVKKLIDVNNWTITFNCTEQDKQRLVRIGIPESNILTHNNTAEDIERVSRMRSNSTMYYSKSVSEGIDASILTNNFYSKSIDND